MEQLQSHIWLTASSGKYLRISSYILGSTSSYMTLQLLHSEFPYIWGKFDFLVFTAQDGNYTEYNCRQRCEKVYTVLYSPRICLFFALQVSSHCHSFIWLDETNPLQSKAEAFTLWPQKQFKPVSCKESMKEGLNTREYSFRSVSGERHQCSKNSKTE